MYHISINIMQEGALAGPGKTRQSKTRSSRKGLVSLVVPLHPRPCQKITYAPCVVLSRCSLLRRRFCRKTFSPLVTLYSTRVTRPLRETRLTHRCRFSRDTRRSTSGPYMKDLQAHFIFHGKKYIYIYFSREHVLCENE